MLNKNGENTTEFIHFSDVHLGHHQFNSEDRYRDICKSFKSMIQDAIDEDVDFVVCSGDFFHNNTDIDNNILRNAEKCLNKLNGNGIPVVTICGNHDINLCRNGLNWYDNHHSIGDLIHLEADLQDPQTIFKEHDSGDCGISSGYVDFGDVRIFGLQYSEKTDVEQIQLLSNEIREMNNAEPPSFTIFLAHFGIAGQLPPTDSDIPYQALKKLNGDNIVNYLALGHGHRRYSHDRWAFNPGSLEAHSAHQTNWDLGYYFVRIESNGEFNFEHRLSNRRPYYEFEFPVDIYDTPSGLRTGFTTRVQREVSHIRQIQELPHFKEQGEKRAPLIEIQVSGLLELNKSWWQRTTNRALNSLGINYPIIPKSEQSDFEQDNFRRIINNELEEVSGIRISDSTETRELTWRGVLRKIRSIFIGTPLLLLLIVPIFLFWMGKYTMGNYESDFYRRDLITLVSLDVAIAQNFPILFGYGIMGSLAIGAGVSLDYLSPDGLLPLDALSAWVTLGLPRNDPVISEILLIGLGAYGMLGLALIASLIISTYNDIEDYFPQTEQEIKRYWQTTASEEIELAHWEIKWAVLGSLEGIIERNYLGNPMLSWIWKKL